MSPGVIIIIFSLIVGLICYKQIKPTIFKLVVFLLSITAINEVVILLFVNNKWKIFFYNCFSLIEIIIWVIIFYVFTKRNVFIIGAGMIIFIASILEIFLKKGFHSISYRMFSIFIIINILIYFRKLITIKHMHSLLKDGVFWICCGLLLFHTVFIFYLTALDFLEFVNAKEALSSFKKIFNAVNIIFYISLSIGLICLSFIRQSRNYFFGEA